MCTMIVSTGVRCTLGIEVRVLPQYMCVWGGTRTEVGGSVYIESKPGNPEYGRPGVVLLVLEPSGN